jgi:hypothetical protein
MSVIAARDVRRNDSCPWDAFAAQPYADNNYASMHEDDRALISLVGRFFASRATGAGWQGVDVGSGSNLYPAMLMLPLSDRITLWEYSSANVAWLEREIPSYSPVWDQYWAECRAAGEMYRQVTDPRSVLAAQATTKHASLFDLPEAEWDIGTMFFVAESMTGVRDEFERATRTFVRSLKPGAPFAAAFIRNSPGYLVGDVPYPAVAVAEPDVCRLLTDLTADLTVLHVAPGTAFRDGWQGMVLALGTRSHH